jgi:hypothetical protein
LGKKTRKRQYRLLNSGFAPPVPLLPSSTMAKNSPLF